MGRAIRASALVWVAILGMQSTAWAESPLGHWWNDGRTGRIEVTEQNGELTGVITWVKERNDDGSPLLDAENPDPALRDRTIEGIVLMEGLTPARRANTWDGGTIYDPDNGTIYRCTLRTDGPDRLLLRGYIGISLIGRTTTWERVTPDELAELSAVASPTAR